MLWKQAKVLKKATSTINLSFPLLHPRRSPTLFASGESERSLAVRMMIIAATFSAYLSPSNRNSSVLYAAKCVVYVESTSPLMLSTYDGECHVLEAFMSRLLVCSGSGLLWPPTSSARLQNFIIKKFVIYGQREGDFLVFSNFSFGFLWAIKILMPNDYDELLSGVKRAEYAEPSKATWTFYSQQSLARPPERQAKIPRTIKPNFSEIFIVVVVVLAAGFA